MSDFTHHNKNRNRVRGGGGEERVTSTTTIMNGDKVKEVDDR